MRTERDLHDYQRRTTDFVVEHSRAALFLDMGLGKTVVTLTAIARLLDFFEIFGALVIAPRRVTETVWKQEAAQWAHLRHLRICILRGDKRVLARAMLRQHDVYVVNYEAIPWLVTQINQRFLEHRRYPPFNMVVFDELSRCKNAEGVRMKALKPLLPFFSRRVGLTGTPAPNGYWDLHGQFLVLDDGERLGEEQRVWREKYFIEDAYTRKRVPAQGSRGKIRAKIADMTISLTDTDYLNLPEYIYNDVVVDMPVKIRTEYEKFERDMFAEMDHGRIEVFNAAALTNKCRQIANGTYIDTEFPDKVIPVHDAKLEALDDVIEEAAGSPVLCAYAFRVDMKRILERYKRRLRCAYLGPGVSDVKAVEIVNDWSRSLYDLLVTHPASAGHGLNLQHGGHHIVWFGLDWSLENWLQLNARLRRQGQRNASVFVHRILSRATVDEAMRLALERKETDQAGLRRALEDYRTTKNDDRRLSA